MAPAETDTDGCRIAMEPGGGGLQTAATNIINSYPDVSGAV